MNDPVTPGNPGASDLADEPALLEALRRGDPRAFETLVGTHGGRLLAVSRRFLRNEEDARDAVQDTFLQAWRAMGDFAGDAKLSTWLHRIVINASLMKLRTRRRRPEESIETLMPKFLEDGHPREPAARWQERSDVALARGETRAMVRECIERLPDAYRTVLLLRDIEELDTGEAAKHLGISPNAVKTRLHRARQALRTLLDPHFREGAPPSPEPGPDAMTCRELVAFLNAYVSGELPPKRRAEFDRHLSVCPPCVAYLESYRDTIRLARGSFERPDDQVPEDVPPRLLAAIRAAITQGR
jgi:RNA polymerase sigma-70 factor (ECF subfamily)